MKKLFIYSLLLTGLFGCSFPTELPVSENAKSADNFSRAFIDKIISGEIESAFSDIEPEMLNDQAKEFIINVNRNINGAIPHKYRVVETDKKSIISTGIGKITNYKFGYEYEFEEGNILFITIIKEKESKFSITAFNGKSLSTPLPELINFTLIGKSALHYIFLIICVLVPLFILTTLMVMLFSKITIKKKIIWTLIIMLVSLPQFSINWGNGQFDFSLLSLGFLGSGFSKPTLYSACILLFHAPIGAILFWVRRKKH